MSNSNVSYKLSSTKKQSRELLVFSKQLRKSQNTNYCELIFLWRWNFSQFVFHFRLFQILTVFASFFGISCFVFTLNDKF